MKDKKSKIFVIEDNESIRKMITSAISNEIKESELFSFESVERALGNTKEKPDYIILDHFLEKTNGIDCIPLFKEFIPEAKILVASSQNDIKTFENAFIFGAKEYFRKDALFIKNIVDYIKKDIENSKIGWFQSLFIKEKKKELNSRKTNLIYILDDNKSVSFSMGHILQSESFNTVEIFNNSKDFFEQVKIEVPDYAILDYNIDEEITGEDVLKQLKSMSSETEVIMFSNQADVETANRLLNLGASIYLSKSQENLLRLRTIINIKQK